MSVRRGLDAVAETGGYVLHERKRRAAVATANQPRHDQFAVSIQRRPRPDITAAERAALVFGDVLRLRIAELPNLVALDALGSQVANVLSLIPRARFAQSNQ